MSRHSRELAARKSELRRRLRVRQTSVRADLRRRRGAALRRRRWPWLLLALLLALLLMARDCSCGHPSLPRPVALPRALEPGEGTEPPPPSRKRSLPTGRNAALDRPTWQVTADRPMDWVESFRMQVVARSPRLAECFVGVANPGRLRWSVSVEPVQGRVSQHELEPILAGEHLSEQQSDCVLDVLSEPPYSLDAGELRGTPTRVGMVIEF